MRAQITAIEEVPSTLLRGAFGDNCAATFAAGGARLFDG